MAAAAVLEARARRELDRTYLAWVGVGVGVGLAAIGVAAQIKLLLAAGVLLSGSLVLVVAPELIYIVFLSAGVLKSNPDLSGIPADLTALCAAAVVVAIGLRVARDGMPPLPAPVAIVPVLAAFSLLSVLWSDLPERGLEKAFIFETFTALAFFAPFFLLRTRSQLIRFMVGAVAIGLFVALTAVKLDHPSNPLVAAGGNEIELALVSGFGLLAAVGYLFVIGAGKWWSLVWIAPATLLGTTILKSGSRGGLVGTALGLIFVVAWLATVRGRGRGPLLAVLAAVAVVAVIAGPQLTGEATNKYRDQLFTTNTAGVIESRDYFLRAGWELAAAHPLGTGLAGYEAATHEKYPHNIALEYGSELGLPGLALFVGLFVAAWFGLSHPAARRTPEAAICGALLILFGMEALVSFGPNESRPLWFAMGFALALPHFRTDR